MLKWLGSSGLALAQPIALRASDLPATYDVLVVGAGVFGVWTAARLHAAGQRVALIEAWGPAHSRASSGGESRVTRCGYGDAELYTDWAWRSLVDWRALSDRAALPLFHNIGVLWIHQQEDPDVAASARALTANKIPFTRLTAVELRARYPVMRIGDSEAGFFEPDGGGLMARRAVQTLAAELAEDGMPLLRGQVQPVLTAAASDGALPFVVTTAGARIAAEQFVMACGPWLDRVCPDAMTGQLSVTRQEVFYFAADREVVGDIPVWADLPYYGLPDLEGRGLKVADDTRGEPLDPDRTDRSATPRRLDAARQFLARRFPTLAEAPLAESRVCQYEDSTNGDFLIDRHPGLDNVWLVGGGSGHGFKHGPAVGTHVAGLLGGYEQPIPRFSLASKRLCNAPSGAGARC